MKKIVFWLIILSVILSGITLIKGILLPFIVAFIFAYLLYPSIQRLHKVTKIPRSIVATIIFVLFISLIGILVVILLPIIYKQIAMFINNIPMYKNYLQVNTIPYLLTKLNSIDPFIADKITSSLEMLLGNFFSIINSIFNNIWNYTMATINIVVILLLLPVILWYLLQEWPQILSTIEKLLPIHQKNRILEILKSINDLLSAYLRGQLYVCLLLATYFTIGLYFLSIEPSILTGILSGFSIIIPYLGLFLACSIALIIAFFNFGFSTKLFYVLMLYIIGNLFEGMYLTPKIIGNHIGLHPLWIIFAVLAAGSLFGIVGILFAIPIAGITKIILQNLIKSYKNSQFYNS